MRQGTKPEPLQPRRDSAPKVQPPRQSWSRMPTSSSKAPSPRWWNGGQRKFMTTGPTLALPWEVEPPGQVTMPLPCRHNCATSLSLLAWQGKEWGELGGEEVYKHETIFPKSFHSTFHMTKPWHPHPSYVSMLSEAFLFWKEKRKGKSSPTFLRFRDNLWQHTLFLLHLDFRGDWISSKRGPILLPLLWGGSCWRKWNLIPAPERVLTSSSVEVHNYLQAFYNANSGR